MNVATKKPSEMEFQKFQHLIQEKVGIYLSPRKIHLLNGRLSKRLQYHDCGSYSDYFNLITSKKGRQELQLAIDLITTNETYFFREPKHFDFLIQNVLKARASKSRLRIWSAASSTGEEPYSIAMTLAAHCSTSWELLASDVNQEVLQKAKKGIFVNKRTNGISEHFRTRFCRQGTGAFEDHMRVVPTLRSQVLFKHINLIDTLPDIGIFDVVFLRNVMIYFKPQTQKQLIAKLYNHVRPGGYLFIGHSESLQGINDQFRAVQPAIYRRS